MGIRGGPSATRFVDLLPSSKSLGALAERSDLTAFLVAWNAQESMRLTISMLPALSGQPWSREEVRLGEGHRRGYICLTWALEEDRTWCPSQNADELAKVIDLATLRGREITLLPTEFEGGLVTACSRLGRGT